MGVARTAKAKGDSSARRVHPLWKSGYTAAQIAMRLELSKRTVERAIAKIRADEEQFRVKSMREIAFSLAWTLNAPCADMDPNIFVPDDEPGWREQPPEPCRTCPFTQECLARGKRTGSEGWWGGKYRRASFVDVMTEGEGDPLDWMRSASGETEAPLQEAG